MSIKKRISFTEVIRELDYQGKLKKNTIIITDFDNTVVTYGQEAKNLFSLHPEKIPNEVLTQIHKIVESGAKLAIATNRPAEGFRLAEAMSNLMGKYPVFPQTLEKMGIEIFGGGDLFMIEKFKESDQSFYTLKSWLLAPEKEGGAAITNSKNITIVCVGDRPGDMSFFEKLQDIIDNDYPEIQFEVYKLPGVGAEDKPDSTTLWDRFVRFVMKFIP